MNPSLGKRFACVQMLTNQWDEINALFVSLLLRMEISSLPHKAVRDLQEQDGMTVVFHMEVCSPWMVCEVELLREVKGLDNTPEWISLGLHSIWQEANVILSREVVPAGWSTLALTTFLLTFWMRIEESVAVKGLFSYSQVYHPICWVVETHVDTASGMFSQYIKGAKPDHGHGDRGECVITLLKADSPAGTAYFCRIWIWFPKLSILIV